MKVLAVLAVVLLLLFLLGQVRVGGQAEYGAAGLAVRVRLGVFRVQVFPWKFEKKQKKPKKKPEKPQKKQKSQEEPPTVSQRIGGALDYAKPLLPLALEAAGCFREKLQIDTLYLELTVGADDPAEAALRYGQASALLGAIWYPLTSAFLVKDGTAHANVDFNAKTTTIYGKLSLSLKVGQIVWLGLYFGIKALRAVLSVRRAHGTQKKRKAV